MATELAALGIFEDYLKAIEDFLINQSTLIRNKKDEYLQEKHNISLSELEKMDFINSAMIYYSSELPYSTEYAGQSDYEEYFPRILRQSFIISLYAQ